MLVYDAFLRRCFCYYFGFMDQLGVLGLLFRVLCCLEGVIAVWLFCLWVWLGFVGAWCFGFCGFVCACFCCFSWCLLRGWAWVDMSGLLDGWDLCLLILFYCLASYFLLLLWLLFGLVGGFVLDLVSTSVVLGF